MRVFSLDRVAAWESRTHGSALEGTAWSSPAAMRAGTRGWTHRDDPHPPPSPRGRGSMRNTAMSTNFADTPPGGFPALARAGGAVLSGPRPGPARVSRPHGKVCGRFRGCRCRGTWALRPGGTGARRGSGRNKGPSRSQKGRITSAPTESRTTASPAGTCSSMASNLTRCNWPHARCGKSRRMTSTYTRLIPRGSLPESNCRRSNARKHLRRHVGINLSLGSEALPTRLRFLR